MAHVLVTVTLENLAGFSDQSVQNSFAFASDVALGSTQRQDIFDAIRDFYSAAGTGQSHALGYYISGHIDRSTGACISRMYDIGGNLDGTPHGSPIDEDAWTLSAGAATAPMAPQTAAVLTLRARNALAYAVEDGGGFRPRARHTGRLYIGPLQRQAANDTDGALSYPHSDFVQDLLKAAENLQDALVDGDYEWGVWSRANELVVPITRVEVADSWGTIRSRRKRPTVRTARTFSPEPALVLGA